MSAQAKRKLFWRGLRRIIPKNRWLRVALIGVPILLVLALLEPVLNLLSKAFELLVGIFAPLVESPGGRLILLNGILVVVGLVMWSSFRSRFREFRRGLRLRRHLDSIQSWLDGDHPTAVEGFERVARSRAPAPAAADWLGDDARLKLARIALDEDQVESALHWLTRIRAGDLPKELRKSLAQLRLRAWREQGDVLPEEVERGLRDALRDAPDDPTLLRLLRELLVERGDLAEVADVQGQILRAAGPDRTEDERRRLVLDLVAAGTAALHRGADQHVVARNFARQALNVEPTSAEAGCLLGDVHLARGEVEAAMRAFGATRSKEGLMRLSAVLEAHPGTVTPREILEACPIDGALLLAAREHARRGEHRAARRAARLAAKRVGLTPTTVTILADVLRHAGSPDEADALLQQGVRALVDT